LQVSSGDFLLLVQSQRTLLHVSANAGHSKVIALLLREQCIADINSADAVEFVFLVFFKALMTSHRVCHAQDGNTALHLALFGGHDVIVQMLHAANADRSIANDDGLAANGIVTSTWVRFKSRVFAAARRAREIFFAHSEKMALLGLYLVGESKLLAVVHCLIPFSSFAQACTGAT
jgi:ankyrin repeat protein